MKPYRLITLDVYTALFDIESSLMPADSDACGAGLIASHI